MELDACMPACCCALTRQITTFLELLVEEYQRCEAVYQDVLPGVFKVRVRARVWARAVAWACRFEVPAGCVSPSYHLAGEASTGLDADPQVNPLHVRTQKWDANEDQMMSQADVTQMIEHFNKNVRRISSPFHRCMGGDSAPHHALASSETRGAPSPHASPPWLNPNVGRAHGVAGQRGGGLLEASAHCGERGHPSGCASRSAASPCTLLRALALAFSRLTFGWTACHEASQRFCSWFCPPASRTPPRRNQQRTGHWRRAAAARPGGLRHQYNGPRRRRRRKLGRGAEPHRSAGAHLLCQRLLQCLSNSPCVAAGETQAHCRRRAPKLCDSRARSLCPPGSFPSRRLLLPPASRHKPARRRHCRLSSRRGCAEPTSAARRSRTRTALHAAHAQRRRPSWR